MNRIIMAVALSWYVINASAQPTVEAVLSEIERNNKTLVSGKQYLEAEKLTQKTGLNPENPRIGYEYLPGRPEGAGTQRDLTLTQGFDFPTSYSKRRNLSDARIALLGLEYSSTRLEVLLEAKLTCIDYIQRTKLQDELNRRAENAGRLYDAITRMADRGEANILEVNKIRLLQLEVKSQAELNRSLLKKLQLQLDELNGGKNLDLAGIRYIPPQEILPFETLDSLIEANDPVVKSRKQEVTVTREQLGLSRSLVLPKFEGGYHRQSILGQTYQGVQVGMTIPLWENTNVVKAEQARLAFSELQVTEHRTQHYYENKQLYEEYTHWQKIFSEYQSILTSANNEELLRKAFDAGELSLIEYLMELRYFYDAISTALEAEKSLHQALARLYRFEL